MTNISIRHLLEAGVHFGHRVSRWNPKMKPLIYGRRNLIHIIDLRETVRGLFRGQNLLREIAAEGGIILFVGTKKQIRPSIEEWAERTGMPHVTDRWLGGLLTNYSIVHRRVHRLDEIESFEQGEAVRTLSKKEMARLLREKRKLMRNLSGVRSMDRLPSAVVVVDPGREHHAVVEAAKLEIPVIGILDTDCDPEPLDIAIPGNDEAMKSVSLLLGILSEGILEGRARREADVAAEAKEAAAAASETEAPGTAGPPPASPAAAGADAAGPSGDAGEKAPPAAPSSPGSTAGPPAPGRPAAAEPAPEASGG